MLWVTGGAIIFRATVNGEFMKQAQIDEILSKINSLPSMPATGAKMLKMLEDPETAVDEIEDVMRHDPGLTGNVLKLANSAYFGIPSKIASTRQAIVMLGLKKLVQLVIASCVNAVMDKPVPGYNMPPGNLWRHSIAVSIAAEALVRDKENFEAQDMFTPALLHDIGKLILGQFVKEEQEAIEKIADTGMPYVEAEQLVLGTNHAEIGAQILARWSFPREIVEAVRWHHDPDQAGEAAASVDIVYLANFLCQTDGGHDQIVTGCPELSKAVIERLRLNVSQFDEIKTKVSQWVDELSQALTFN
jgi:putative nucleotidyltransferase with HDIG domain